ncbi:MAG: hypothetical protein AB1331_03170 [Bacillota bacterium]
MNDFWPVLKVTLNNVFGLSAARHRYLIRREKIWEPVLIGLTIIAALSSFSFVLFQPAKALVSAGAALNQPQLVFTALIASSQVIFLVTGILLMISSFFLSNDLTILVPLPVKPGSVLTAKFIAVVIQQYLFQVVFFAGAILAYTPRFGGGLAYWLTLAAVFLLNPVLPMTIAGLLTTVVMRFINRRHRDLLMIIASVLLLVVILGFQLSLTAIPETEMPEFMERLMTSRLGLVRAAGRVFPPSIWASQAVAEAGTLAGLGSLALVVGVNLAAMLLLFPVGNLLFYRGLIGGQEVARRRQSAQRVLGSIRQVSAFWSLFRREWRLFIRNPMYVMNSYVGALIVPVMMAFAALQQDALGDLIEQAKASPAGLLAITLGVAAAIAFLGSVNAIAATSISREGKCIWISRSIPAAPEVQAQAKLFHGVVAATISSVPTLVVFAWLLRPGIGPVVAAGVLGVVASLLPQTLGLMVDISRPMLGWTDPVAAVKRNFNAVWPMALMIPMVLLGVVIGRWLANAGFSAVGAAAALALIFAGLDLVAYRLLSARAPSLYQQLEV